MRCAPRRPSQLCRLVTTMSFAPGVKRRFLYTRRSSPRAPHATTRTQNAKEPMIPVMLLRSRFASASAPGHLACRNFMAPVLSSIGSLAFVLVLMWRVERGAPRVQKPMLHTWSKTHCCDRTVRHHGARRPRRTDLEAQALPTP